MSQSPSDFHEHHSHEPSLQVDKASQKTFGAYLVGLILCVILTLIAFGLVDKRSFDSAGLFIAVSVLAIIQFFVQCICFLRLNAGVEGRWNLWPFLFSIFVIAVLVGGSLWIMYNLNYFMMH